MCSCTVAKQLSRLLNVKASSQVATDLLDATYSCNLIQWFHQWGLQMTSAKIRIKVGTMELEYEGDPAFLTGGIEALLVTMGGLAANVPAEVLPMPPKQTVNGSIEPAQVHNGSPAFTTNTIAAHLDAKSGPELVICAMARLEIAQGKATSSRSEILAEMKSATTYFKETMTSNLSSSLAGLTKTKRINQQAKDIYSLSSTEKKAVEAKVAEIG